MQKKTLSQVKNLMRRALADVIDPPPSQADQVCLREHFGHQCCYCGADSRPRDGHIDHAEVRGGNGLGNLLLACRTCNGDEKREMGWQDFLRRKCSDETVFAERSARISTWLARHPPPHHELAAEVEAAHREAEGAIAAYARAYDKLRSAAARARLGQTASCTSE
jgi:5-methylcytosine-specific restriction endonuclease McrA